jgi:agmatine deiminase
VRGLAPGRRAFPTPNFFRTLSSQIGSLVPLHTPVPAMPIAPVFRQPAEWRAHQTVWTAWPSDPDLWQEDLEPARSEVGALIRAIRDGGRGEAVDLLAATAEAEAGARAAFAEDLEVRVHAIPFGDIWLRDTGPLFLEAGGEIRAAGFRFNGWGEKYLLDHDAEVAARVAERQGVPLDRFDWVLEGGAIDVDGTGRAVTTEECLLNPNRNPGLSREELETRLQDHLGIDEVIWLGHGLLNDHTDGHVDNLARFIGPGRLLLQRPSGSDDPNAEVYRDAERRARAAGLDLVTIPSPGRVEREGRVVPASHLNFYLGNTTVVVPQYGTAWDAPALQTFEDIFPGRRVVGVPSNALLTGGGSFHCITQQVPLPSGGEE